MFRYKFDNIWRIALLTVCSTFRAAGVRLELDPKYGHHAFLQCVLVR